MDEGQRPCSEDCVQVLDRDLLDREDLGRVWFRVLGGGLLSAEKWNNSSFEGSLGGLL